MSRVIAVAAEHVLVLMLGLVFVLGLGLGLGAAGCATKTLRAPTPAPADEIPADARFAVLETLEAEGSIAGAEIHPFHEGEWVYEGLPGGDAAAGSTTTHRVGPTEGFGAAIAVALGGARKEFIGVDGKDRIVMPAALDRAQSALTLFDPPLAIAPVMLAAGGEFRSEVDMRVVDARNPQRQRESGRAVRTISYVDDQRVRTPLGDLRAKRLVVRFTADLRLADAITNTTLWVVPGLGVVARDQEETITVLGIPGKPSRERLVLRSAPGGRSAR